jgi:hypothetical protein
MSSFTQAGISNTLKNVWVNIIELENARVSPTYAMMKKNTDWVGDGLTTVLPYGNGAGRSRSYPKAVANSDNSKNMKFTFYDTEDFAIFNVQNKALKAAKNNKGAVVRHLYRESRGKHIEIMSSIVRSIHRDGSGVIGRRASLASNTITLTNRWDIINFSPGDVVIAATAPTGGTLRTGTAVVASINPDAANKTATVTLEDATDIDSFADNDYLFIDGDRGIGCAGFEAWNPETVTSTDFGGTGNDRTINPWVLAGLRVDGTAGNNREAISEGLSIAGMIKGRPRYGIVTFEHFEALKLEIGSHREYVDVRARNVDVGFRGIEFHAPNGGEPVVILPDTHAIPQVCRLLDFEDWTIHSRDGLPHLKDEDGLTMIRNTTTSDSYQGQWIAYYQVNPDNGILKNTVRVKMPALRT